jgi:DNA modification methylase
VAPIKTVRMHRNVQFIYEKSLAEQELESFGITDFVSTRSDPWTYRFNGAGDPEALLKRSAYFASVNGRESIYKKLILPGYQRGKYNITRSVNQYLTHWIYPYKGKFHPQMVRALLNILGIECGQVVLDPFVGSGTTAVECMLMGIDFLGVDISPLCILISRVKTAAWHCAEDIGRAVESEESRPSGADPRINDFFIMADMVTESDVSVRNRDRDSWRPKNVKKMLRSVCDMRLAKTELGLSFGSVTLSCGDCRQLESVGIGAASVDAVITSPPYSIALDYVKNDAHALRALGLAPEVIREEFIGVRGKIKRRLHLYNEDMKLVFKEMARVLKPGAPAAIVIGDATDGTEITTTEDMKNWGQPYGLKFERELPKIVFGLYSVITDEKILFFRKDKQ